MSISAPKTTVIAKECATRLWQSPSNRNYLLRRLPHRRPQAYYRFAMTAEFGIVRQQSNP